MAVCEAEYGPGVEAFGVCGEFQGAVSGIGRRASPPPDLEAVSRPWPGLADVARPVGGGELMFAVLWLFIGFVSAIDVYLTVRFQDLLWYEEQNPIGRLLLGMANWEPSLLIGVKFMGSTLVLGVLSALFARSRRLGFIVTSAVAGFQLGLLWYLLMA